MTLIKDLVAPSVIRGRYLVTESKEDITKATPPSSYVDLMVRDKTGEVQCKLWDTKLNETLQVGKVLDIKATVKLFRNKPQLVVSDYSEAPVNEVQMFDYIKAAPITFDEAMAYIMPIVKIIEPVELRSVVAYCIKRCREKLASHPAAKGMHHDFYGGLYYHITRMLQLAVSICEQRPFLNKSLLYAGIILHDLAKTEEMLAQDGIVSDYSVRGKLLGHIAIISIWITDAYHELKFDRDSELFDVIQHIVLSHHGKEEWGSPVKPQVPEAVALHWIDQLDAKLQAVEDACSNVGAETQWTAAVRSADSKAMYMYKF